MRHGIGWFAEVVGDAHSRTRMGTRARGDSMTLSRARMGTRQSAPAVHLPYMLGRRWLMGHGYFISMQLGGGKRRGAKPRQAGRHPLISFQRKPALLSLPGLHKAILHTAQWRSRAQRAPVHCGRVLQRCQASRERERAEALSYFRYPPTAD